MPSKTISSVSQIHGSRTKFPPAMRKALLLAYLWINLSEIFRYFVLVMPMTRAALTRVSDVAPMNLPVFLIWGLWDTLLFVCVAATTWLYFERFAGGRGNVLAAGTLCWATIFCIFWLATWNMNLTTAKIPLTALPLAWLEMVVAAGVVERGWRSSRSSTGHR